MGNKLNVASRNMREKSNSKSPSIGGFRGLDLNHHQIQFFGLASRLGGIEVEIRQQTE